jgi:hypothetical protein
MASKGGLAARAGWLAAFIGPPAVAAALLRQAIAGHQAEAIALGLAYEGVVAGTRFATGVAGDLATRWQKRLADRADLLLLLLLRQVSGFDRQYREFVLADVRFIDRALHRDLARADALAYALGLDKDRAIGRALSRALSQALPGDAGTAFDWTADFRRRSSRLQASGTTTGWSRLMPFQESSAPPRRRSRKWQPELCSASQRRLLGWSRLPADSSGRLRQCSIAGNKSPPQELRRCDSRLSAWEPKLTDFLTAC